jgi:GT2 family glycosyltransferase
MSPGTTVVIVNFNAGRHLLKCLAALRRQSYPHRVLVIDNASTDGSTRLAAAAHPEIQVVPLRRNVGFARAVNIAAQRVASANDIMVTLNPDTVPRADFLEEVVRPLEHDPELSSTAGTLVFSSAPTIVASAGVVVHRNGVALDARLGTTVSPGPPEPVFGPSAGAAAYRLSAFHGCGGFCEAFFLYLEDVDLAWRMRLLGLESLSVPTAIAEHAYSASAIEGSPLKRRLLARNRLWTLARCLPAERWSRDYPYIIAFDLLTLGYGVIARDTAALRGRAEGLATLPLRLLERAAIQRSATVCGEALDRWVQDPIAPRQLRKLRMLTRRLASTPRY